jgi:uncharacterized protein (DUF983 family)
VPKKDDDNCGMPCPKCRRGGCFKAWFHFGQSKHVCDNCRHDWW